MRHLLFPLTLLGIALAGCGDRHAPTSSITALDAAASARTAPLATVSLIVTVSNVDAAGGATAIRGDGLGDYTDGIQNVQAVLDPSGTFAFNTNTSRKAAIRWVNYNFNSPVDQSNTYRPSPNNQVYHFSTGPSSFSPFTAIQNLGVNGNPVTECIYMGNGLSNATTGWRVSFHKGLEDVNNSPTAYAVVTRTSVSPAVWTVTPVGSCSGASSIAALRSGDGTVLYGYYNLPFFLTLRAK